MVKAMNKNGVTLLVGIIALIAGALAAFFFIKKKMDEQADDFDEFEDFDMIGDDDDFFGEDDYSEYEGFVNGEDSEMPYAETEEEAEKEDEEL